MVGSNLHNPSFFILFKWASGSEVVGSNPHSLTLFPCYFASPFRAKVVGLIPRPRILFFHYFISLGAYWELMGSNSTPPIYLIT